LQTPTAALRPVGGYLEIIKNFFNVCIKPLSGFATADRVFESSQLLKEKSIPFLSLSSLPKPSYNPSEKLLQNAATDFQNRSTQILLRCFLYN
jgi:hypothetical protein